MIEAFPLHWSMGYSRSKEQIDSRFKVTNPVSFNEHQYPVKGSLGLWDFDQMICLQCGCTEEDACVHPDFGSCWWAEPYLCSHCAKKH